LLSTIDWTRPWFCHSPRPHPASVAVTCARLSTRRHRAASTPGLPLRFVPQDTLPEGVAYESHIFATGQVPTRDNLHDAFNALIWLHFPETKRLLNRLQAEAIERDGVQAVRGACATRRRCSTRTP
jgi:hypothetical protein